MIGGLRGPTLYLLIGNLVATGRRGFCGTYSGPATGSSPRVPSAPPAGRTVSDHRPPRREPPSELRPERMEPPQPVDAAAASPVVPLPPTASPVTVACRRGPVGLVVEDDRRGAAVVLVSGVSVGAIALGQIHTDLGDGVALTGEETEPAFQGTGIGAYEGGFNMLVVGTDNDPEQSTASSGSATRPSTTSTSCCTSRPTTRTRRR